MASPTASGAAWSGEHTQVQCHARRASTMHALGVYTMRSADDKVRASTRNNHPLARINVQRPPGAVLLDRRHSFCVRLTRADAHDLLNGEDEDLSIPHASGTRAPLNNADSALHE